MKEFLLLIFCLSSFPTAIIRDVVKERAAAYFKLHELENDVTRIASEAQSLLDQDESTEFDKPTETETEVGEMTLYY